MIAGAYNGWEFGRDALFALLLIVIVLAFMTDFFNNIGRRRK